MKDSKTVRIEHQSFVDAYKQINESSAQDKPVEEGYGYKKPKKKTRRYLTEIKTWGVNNAKWKAATEYAENKGWKFIIMTDETLAP